MNTCKHTFEYAGAEKQTAEKSDFTIFLLCHTKTLDYNNIAFVVVAPFSLFVCKLAGVVVLAGCGSSKF